MHVNAVGFRGLMHTDLFITGMFLVLIMLGQIDQHDCGCNYNLQWSAIMVQKPMSLELLKAVHSYTHVCESDYEQEDMVG